MINIEILKKINNKFESIVSQILRSKGVILAQLKEANSKNENYKIEYLKFPIIKEVVPVFNAGEEIPWFNLEGALQNWDMVEFYATEESFDAQMSLCATEFANKIFSKFRDVDSTKFLVYARAKNTDTLKHTIQGELSSLKIIEEYYQTRFIFDILYDIKET